MATYYWVGGSGNWASGNATNWSASSGGSGGAGVPVSTDSVVFDANSGSGTVSVQSSATCSSVTQNTSTLIVSLSADFYAYGTYTLTKGSLTLSSNNLSCSIFSSNNTNSRTVNFGTGQIKVYGSASTIVSMTNTTNFSYTGTAVINCTYSGSTGTRTLGIGNTGGAYYNVPSVYISSGRDTVALSTNFYCLDLNFTGFAGTLSASARVIYGNLTLGSGMSVASTLVITTFAAISGNYTINTNGAAFPCAVVFGNTPSTATWSLASDFTSASNRPLAIAYGTFDANGYNLTIGNFTTSTGTATASLNMGSGTWNLQSSGICWDVTTEANSFTLNAQSSTIVLSYASSATITLNMGPYAYNNISISGSTAIATVQLKGGFSANSLTSSRSSAYTIQFDSATTTSFNRFRLLGSSGKIIYISSSTPGSNATVSQGVGTVSCNYINLSNISATGGASWFAGANSVNGGGNTGWIFSNPPWGNGVQFFT